MGKSARRPNKLVSVSMKMFLKHYLAFFILASALTLQQAEASHKEARCPPLKTVPYTCAPGATDTSQCIYGAYHGTYSLTVEASPHCPKAMGFSGLENSNLGCLYTRTGTSETYCFKAMTDSGEEEDEVSVKWALPAGDIRSCLSVDLFPDFPFMDGYQQAALCCGSQDCQENAGCFLDEASSQFRTRCQCYLGYGLTPDEQAPLPISGQCKKLEALAEEVSDCKDSVCFSTPSESYTVCPYCQVFKGDMTLGSYKSGNGIFQTEEPMLFIGSSTPECTNNTSMEVYWYCWYDMYDDIVDLSQTFLVVEEAEDCEHYAYIYTPLACPFASSQD